MISNYIQYFCWSLTSCLQVGQNHMLNIEVLLIIEPFAFSHIITFTLSQCEAYIKLLRSRKWMVINIIYWHCEKK